MLKHDAPSEGYKACDSTYAKVRRSNLNNVGLDTEAPQGESFGGFRAADSHSNIKRGFIKVPTNDGTNGPRYIPIEYLAENNTSFFKTSQGEVYGFVDNDGNIYLDETVITPEHPIHEYTHLWDRTVAKRNPKLWNRGVELMQQTSLWKEIEESSQYGALWKSQGIEGSKLTNLIASEVY